MKTSAIFSRNLRFFAIKMSCTSATPDAQCRKRAPETEEPSTSCSDKFQHKKKRRIENRTAEVDPEYYFENGLRKVRPYYFTYSCHAKGRWLGRSIFDVFSKEFRSSEEILEMSQNLGRITVNGVPVSDVKNYKIKDNDFIQHKVHKHETPILDKPIEIVFENEDVVVNPRGSIRGYTVHGYEGLKILYRLDRTTSGLLIFAKNRKTDAKMKEQIFKHEIEKEYICKVEGVFPDEVTCSEPLDTLHPAIGIVRVSPEGKESITRFERVWSDGKFSVLRCFPKTGRTHQIRVHLQYLGFPIDDDYMYNSEIFGPEKGKGGNFGKSIDELLKDLGAEYSAANWYTPQTEQKMSENAKDSKYLDEHCMQCRSEKKDPTERTLGIHLHCLKYKTDSWCYETELPQWAKEEKETVTS